MSSSHRSSVVVEGNKNEPTYEARLNSSKKNQVVRLVNSTNEKVKFVAKLGPSVANDSIEICPSDGFIQPRYFSNIYVTFKRNTETKSRSYIALKVYYWHIEKSTKKIVAKGSVPIIMMRPDKSKDASFFWFAFILFRSMFLLALIVYNLYLIRFFFDE